ncbi:secretin receptor [Clupea harengus]|uniref:Secretin receptor n=1 Tax=Clupea harengus TaxID=7950 RepID=A0A6P8ETK6_CLUHA|nr:secretin receptor [Clupea harengus]
MRVVFVGILFALITKIHAFECESQNFHAKEEEACNNELHAFNLSGIQPDCSGLWDDLNCWPPSQIGQTVSQPCPEFLKTLGRIYRNCTEEGWSDAFSPHGSACELAINESFTFLSETPQFHSYLPYVKAMYTVGYAVSLISLVIAIAILCLFPKLHCTRNYIHIQLFLSFIFRAAFIFIKDYVLFSSEAIYHCDSYSLACKLVLLISNYCIMANYSWLLVEGHYLHTLVTVSFSERKYFWCYVVLGWGMPMITVGAWGLAKYFYEDEGCWETRGSDWIWWILRVPVLLFLVVNLFFFLNIIRILVGKLRMSDVHGNEFNQFKRLAKSTFLLVALFGLYYILFAFLPHKVDGLIYMIWNFTELAIASTQGFVVAVLYCFLNGEVQYEIQRKWRRWRMKQRLNGTPNLHHGSMSQSGCPLTQVSLMPRSPASRQFSLV